MMSLFMLSAKKLITNVALAMVSDKFMEFAFFNLAERIVKSTETKHDDVWLAKLKEEYKK
ncbi:MAG: hypothetical protein ACRC6V_02150 [Bacteroidales bacterium]